MISRRRSSLAAGLSFFGLTTAFLWPRAVRPGHLLFLIRTLSKAPTLTSKEIAGLHAWLREQAVHLKTVAADLGVWILVDLGVRP